VAHTSDAPCDLVRPEQLAVELIVESVARSFIVDHHYSRTFPSARLCIGLYRKRGLEPSELVGTCVFSLPCNEATLPAYLPGISGTFGVELGRFVLLNREPRNTKSWFIG
jgi:hypothetical protein